METLSLPTIRNNGSLATNGHSRISLLEQSVLERKVADWVVFCLQTRHDPPLSRPLTIHLDALLGMIISPKDVVAVSFEAYRTLIEQMARLGISDTIMPTLSIPLEDTESLAAGPVDAETLLGQIKYSEQPSLYLTERVLKTMMNSFENYIFPLHLSHFLEDTGEYSVFYSVSRSLEDIENGWEYRRNIVAEYYPPAYQYLP